MRVEPLTINHGGTSAGFLSLADALAQPGTQSVFVHFPMNTAGYAAFLMATARRLFESHCIDGALVPASKRLWRHAPLLDTKLQFELNEIQLMEKMKILMILLLISQIKEMQL